jgi:hypothetical protein
VLVECIHTYTSRNLKLCNLFIDGYEINSINPTFHCLIIHPFQGYVCSQKRCLVHYGFALTALSVRESSLIQDYTMKTFGEMEVALHAFLPIALDGVSAALHVTLPTYDAPGIHETESSVDSECFVEYKNGVLSLGKCIITDFCVMSRAFMF